MFWKCLLEMALKGCPFDNTDNKYIGFSKNYVKGLCITNTYLILPCVILLEFMFSRCYFTFNRFSGALLLTFQLARALLSSVTFSTCISRYAIVVPLAFNSLPPYVRIFISYLCLWGFQRGWQWL